MDALTPCGVSRANFWGWPAAFLTNGLLRVAAVPDIGGRLMAYDLGDFPFLFVDPHLAGKLFSPAENQGDGSLAAWKNYGGDKTWPAPQGWDGPHQWPGPPDPILDTGRYTLAELAADGHSAWLSMVSPPGSPTGVQITRRAAIVAGSSRVQLRLTFTNIARHPIRWSIWDVAQLRADRPGPGGRPTWEPGCVVTAPLNPQSRFARGYNVMFGAPDNPQWQVEGDLFVARYQFEIGKVGLDSRGGWIAFANTAAGYAFAERFAIEPQADYPDAGADIECWTVGRGRVATLSYDENSGPFLMETEVLSPFYDIAPGDSADFEIEWGACRCDGPVVKVSEAGCVTQPLTIRLHEGRAQVNGVFGVFDVGHLELVWLNSVGTALAGEVLQPVNPLVLARVAHQTSVPASAVTARLDVVAQTGGRRALASARLDQAQ
ncbi:MAG: hypothetical protein RMN25_07745 [Anaerolineae bacterium]|nr:DUF4380 domain-containing protein [Thermoflexales bacterium]MDW8407664.1 hypothetical protein [Anaerolineae bacterium]